ncbi:2-methylisocitrate dehydratase, Fe/S-dependent, partial [Vibrio parahaemolyticus V-223/04]
NYLTKW